MEAPLVSIVIVCMNRLDNLYPCLEGVRAHTGVPYECFVVAYRFSPENLAKAIRFLSSVPDVTVQVEAEYNAEEAEEK